MRDAVEAGKLKGNEKLPAKMVLTIGGVSLSHEITDEIELRIGATSSPLPLWERVDRMSVSSFETGEGSVFAERTPHPPCLRQGTFSHKGRRKKGRPRSYEGKHHMDIKVRDSNGALLAEGDSVTLIKDLKLKGSSTVLKRGTVIKNIHLTDDPDEIEGRTDKVKGLVLRTEFLKKA